MIIVMMITMTLDHAVADDVVVTKSLVHHTSSHIDQ